MDNSSCESEESESEESDYSEKPYKQLRDGEMKVKLKEETFKCPFCPEKKKQRYKELLVAKSTTRNCKQKANHLALSKYLHKELAGDAEPVISLSKQNQAAVVNDDMYVWPWMGIFISLLRGNDDDKSLLLDSAYWLRKLARFNPLEVKTLWVEEDSAVAVIPRFNGGMDGFKSATELEKEFDVKRCGREDWRGDWRRFKFKTYGWCARADDYNSQGSIAEYLSTVGRLRSFSDISKEELQKSDNVAYDLDDKIYMMDEDYNQVQFKYKVETISPQRLLMEKHTMDQTYKQGCRSFHSAPSTGSYEKKRC